jgi:hypothetical protein
VLATGLSAGPDVAVLVAGITLVSGLLFLVLAVFRMGGCRSSSRGPWSPGSSSVPRSTS